MVGRLTHGGARCACPQRSEDSRSETSPWSFAIEFGGYCAAYPTYVPVGNTGTTSTGRGV